LENTSLSWPGKYLPVSFGEKQQEGKREKAENVNLKTERHQIMRILTLKG
jgi:hypothetical protein